MSRLRMAGKLAKFLGRGFQSAPGAKVTAGDIANRLTLDALFGVVQGVNTPGDLGDKVVAGTMTTLGGGLGGGVLSAALPGNLRFNGTARQLAEVAGGIGGDMLGQSAGDQLMRAKSSLQGTGGLTPWERLQIGEDQRRRHRMEQQVLAQYGIGGYNVPQMGDPFLQQNGLG